MFMTWKLGKHWKANFVLGSNKASFQSGNINFSCPVRAIKRKDVIQGYKVKYCFPSFLKLHIASFAKRRKATVQESAMLHCYPHSFSNLWSGTTQLLTINSVVHLPVVVGKTLGMGSVD